MNITNEDGTTVYASYNEIAFASATSYSAVACGTDVGIIVSMSNAQPTSLPFSQKAKFGELDAFLPSD